MASDPRKAPLSRIALIGVTGLPEGPEDLRFQFGGLIGADFFFERGGIIDIGSKTLYFK